MTVAAIEAGSAGAASGAGAGAGAGSAAAAGTGAAVSRGTSPAARRPSSSGRKGPSRARHRAGPPSPSQAQAAWIQRTKDAPPPTIMLGVDDSKYRRILLAEFMACVVLVGGAPFLTPRKKDQSPQDAAASMSLTQPMARLTAVCVVFFILSLLTTGVRSGKITAAFGALVTMGTLINATDAIKGLNLVFSSSPTAQTLADTAQSVNEQPVAV